MIACRLSEACRQALYIKPRLGYNRIFQPGFTMNYRRNDTVDVLYAVDEMFSCHILTESEEQHRVTVPPCGCLVINSAVRYRLVIDRPVQILSISFTFQEETAEGYPLTALMEKAPGFRLFSEADRDFVTFPGNAELLGPMRSLLDSVVEHPYEPDTVLALQQALYVALFFVELTMNYRDSELTPQQGWYIEQVKAFIEKNVGENLTIPQIAQTVNLHPNYLERLFKKTENCTIVDYINHQRILKAAYLLRTTDWSIESIAYEAGFNNRQHFSKMFNRFIKMSPMGYRMLLHIKRYGENKSTEDIAESTETTEE